MRIFADTSALIALLDEDDHRHDEASATFRALVATAELVTHNYIHVEAVAVATRRLGAEAAQTLIDSLLPVMATIWIDEAVHRTALATHRAVGGTVSLVDQVSFAVMRQHGIEIAFAFDADFEVQGFRPPHTSPEGQTWRISEVPAAYGASHQGVSDLVSVSEIATRAGRPVNTIQSWRRRHSDFPTPVAQLAAGPIWHWPLVAQWIATRPERRIASDAA
ncbi:MAG: PIN domain-containing protein [Chloroflexota bacterium]